MKKLFLFCAGFLLFPASLTAQVSAFTTISILEEAGLSVSLIYRDTAGVACDNWLQLHIRNNSKAPVLLESVGCSVEERRSTGSWYYLPLSGENNSGPEIGPGETWRCTGPLTKKAYRSAMKASSYTANLFFKPLITVVVNGKHLLLSDDDVPFCFYWNNSYAYLSAELASRMQQLQENPDPSPTNTLLIQTMLTDTSTAALIPEEILTITILRQKKSDTNIDNKLILKELSRRGLKHISALTQKYKTLLQDTTATIPSDLHYYWDNTLLPYLLNRNADNTRVFATLKSNQNSWGADGKNCRMVYDYMKRNTGFSEDSIPNQAGFQQWCFKMNTLAISRDKRFIHYCMGLLDNSTELIYEDWSAMEHSGIIRDDQQPKYVPMQIGDVAYKALLQATASKRREEGFVPSSKAALKEWVIQHQSSAFQTSIFFYAMAVVILLAVFFLVKFLGGQNR